MKESDVEEKEKEIKTEKKEPTEDELLLVRSERINSISSTYQNDDYRDILLLNDLDFFYKTGKIPFVFLTHLLCTILVTLLILTQNGNLNTLMQQARAVQASFYLLKHFFLRLFPFCNFRLLFVLVFLLSYFHLNYYFHPWA